MPPEYFMHACTFWEAVLFLEGMHRRDHSAWEQARYISYHTAAPHCKNFKFQDMGQFPWEKEKEPPVDEATALKEIEEIRELARIRDAEYLKNIQQ